MFPNSRLFEEKPKIKLYKNQTNEINLLKKKIKEGDYTYEEVDCEVCKNKEKTIISKFDRYGLPYVSNLCKTCGLIYTSPRFNQKSYIKFYDSQYRKMYTSFPLQQTKEDFFKSQVTRGKKVFDFILKNNPDKNIGSVLDVGCGMGGLLVPFKENNFDVYGVDYGSEYVEFGKSKNLNLSIGGIKDISKKFDVIIYSHVFEHILDLGSELYEIKKRLNKKGVLYIEVPGVLNLHNDYRNDLNRYFQNAHTYNYSLISLNNVLVSNGFELINGNEKVETLFKISNVTDSVTNDYDRLINEIKKLNFKNKIWVFSKAGVKNLLRHLLIKTGLYNITRKFYILIFS
ncbi:class I SAM-dependent methyltransferase [Flavobacteriaceae bacterium]|nr:class I SAM-dependent methyltransferase [Flavobacteriaceae bacterium]